GASDRVDGDGHRDRPAGPDQAGGTLYVLRGDVVEGAPLIVRAPATPVLNGFEHGLELGERDVRHPPPRLRQSHRLLTRQRIAPGSGVSISPRSGSPAVIAPSTTIRCPDRYEASSE